MTVTDALIINHQITSFAPTQSHYAVALDPDHLDIFCLRHTEHFKDQIWYVLGTFDFKNFILFAIDIYLVRILGFAKFTGADFVDGRKAIVLVVVEAASTEPLPQTRKMDIAA